MTAPDLNKFIDEMERFDACVERLAFGQYVVPISPLAPQYNYRDLHRYCQEEGINASQLTKEELNVFEL